MLIADQTVLTRSNLLDDPSHTAVASIASPIVAILMPADPIGGLL
jgi:hypothetical protein